MVKQNATMKSVHFVLKFLKGMNRFKFTFLWSDQREILKDLLKREIATIENNIGCLADDPIKEEFLKDLRNMRKLLKKL